MRRSTRGFTTVEVIIAIILLSVGVLALSSAAGSVTRMMYQARNKTKSGIVAAKVLENMRSDAKLTSPQCTSLSASSGTDQGMSWVSDITAAGNTRNIRVIVSYRTGSLRSAGGYTGSDTVYATIYCQ